MPNPEDLEEQEETAIHQQPKASYEAVDETEPRRDKSPIIAMGLGGEDSSPIVLGDVETEKQAIFQTDKEPIVSVEVSEDEIASS